MTRWGSPLQRFYAKVQKTETCWLWIGGHKAAGYGQFLVDRRKVIAHRWSYEHFVGPIPKDLEIDHLCRNPPCVNPAHLEAVTREENCRRQWADKTHCVNNHEYTEANTYMWRDRNGYLCRRCRTCNTQKANEYYQRNKQRRN